MNQIVMAHFEVEKNDRRYVLIVPSDAPIGEMYDAIHELLLGTVELSRQAAARVKPASPEVAAEVV